MSRGTWLAVGIGLLGASAARADVHVQTPWAAVHVGKPEVYVQVLGFTIRVPRTAAMPAAIPALPPEPTPLTPPPPPTPVKPTETLPVPVEMPPEPAAAPVRALTIGELAAALGPQAGPHEVVVVHPSTGRPVVVRFTLPAPARRVRVHPHRVAIDCGRRDVVLVFLRNGGVRVRQ